MHLQMFKQLCQYISSLCSLHKQLCLFIAAPVTSIVHVMRVNYTAATVKDLPDLPAPPIGKHKEQEVPSVIMCPCSCSCSSHQ